MQPFIALTDKAWFDFLAARAGGTTLDEVNFWSPMSPRRMKKFALGEPIFFRLKSPHKAITGYGFFAHFCTLSLRDAWDFFGWKNGDPDEMRFLSRIGGYRKTNPFTPGQEAAPLGCTVLRHARFWPEDRWLEWGDARGWKNNVVRGATETDPHRADRLMAEIAADRQTAPEDLIDIFEPVEADERILITSRQVQREGQGTFRARLLDAYGRRCAITGERTELVLDAAHIQPYLGPRSNHIQNGLLLTKEFHTLFDNGYVTVSPEHSIMVSPRLRQEWHNGKRYYEFDGAPLRPPVDLPAAPSPAALAWHRERVFRT
jgi:putative restriction endonuclease